MLIHQAVYGSDRGGHAYLRGSATTLEPIFKALAWAADLPSTLPANVAWQGYLRGLTVDSYYVLFYTQPDESAPRAGMVVSRAAFIPLSDLATLDNLSPLAAALREPLVKGQSIEPFAMEPGEAEDSGQSTNIPPLVASAANGFVTKTQLPIVHFGQQGFDDAMLDLWRRLPGELRAQMSFGLSFGPQDTEGRELLVVCTPEVLRGRWVGFTALSDASNVEALTPAASALLNVSQGRQLRDFAARLEFPLNSFKALSLLEQAYQAYSRGTSVQDHINVVRMLASLSKANNKGLIIKAEVLKKLDSQVAFMTVSDVRLLRNLELSAFQNPSAFWKTVECWVTHEMFVLSNDITLVGLSLADAVSNNAVDDWCNSVIAGIRKTLARPRVPAALMHSIWKAFESAPSNVGQLLELFISGSEVETELCAAAPDNLSSSVAEALVDAAAQRELWSVCGTVLATQYDPRIAVECLLRLLVKTKNTSGVVAALSRATPEQKVDVAVHLDDVRVTEIAGKACTQDTTLLGNFDILQPVWFDILEIVLAHDQDALREVPSSEGLVDRLISQTSTGTDLVRIWSVVARTCLSNLVAAKGRAGAWAILPPVPRIAILKKTAEAWLDQFARGRQDSAFLEQELAIAVEAFARESDFFGKSMRTAPSVAVRYLLEIHQGSDWTVRNSIKDLAENVPLNGLTLFDAEALGRGIRDRQWSACASAAFDAARKRADFIPVVRECKELLGIFERIALAWEINLDSSVSPDDLWALLESHAAQLYPFGPTDGEIWSRSGGANEELLNEGNGKARWHRALKDVRAGRGVNPLRLLEQMHEEFPNNKALTWLIAQQFGRQQ